MTFDVSILFQRLDEQLRLTLIMLERAAVQRQILALVVITLVAWLVPRLLDILLARLDPPSDAEAEGIDGAGADEGEPLARADKNWRRRILRWVRAADYMLLPVLWLLFADAAVGYFRQNEWPYGLIEGARPIFWLVLGYRVVVGFVLAAMAERRAEHVAKRYVRPVLWLLVVLVARTILFSTLAINDIILFQFEHIQYTLASILDALTIFLTFLLVAWIVHGLIRRVLMRGGAEPDVSNTVSNVSRYVVLGLGAMIALGALGIDLSTLAWIGGGLSVGIGFGLQEIFGNFVSGIVLVFERILRPGDVVETQGVRGTVSRVRMRSTVIRTADNIEIFVPNKELLTKTLSAYTYSDHTARVRIDVGVAYETDLDKAQEVLLETIRRHPLILGDPAPSVILSELGAYSVNFVVFGYVRQFSDTFTVKSELIKMIRDALVLNGVSIPFPRQDILLLQRAQTEA
ncbi:MAG: mechanosensitive ion channel [Caldilineaceae bacterium]|nr:mechanosensitive ion channel [Caldilineaceae bacterium]